MIIFTQLTESLDTPQKAPLNFCEKTYIEDARKCKQRLRGENTWQCLESALISVYGKYRS